MRILWIATKAPWPPRDGGRLLLWETLRALAEAGHRPTLVAPLDAATAVSGPESVEQVRRRLDELATPVLVAADRPSKAEAALRALASGGAAGFLRQRSRAMARQVAELVRDQRFDVAVAQPIQALANLAPLHAAGVPVVVRAENVECDLAAARAVAARGLAALAFAAEARRLRRAERAAITAAPLTLALTERDRTRFGELAPGARIETARAPFAPRERRRFTAAAESARIVTAPNQSAPRILLLGSAGWSPNVDADRWFLAEVWPRVRERSPASRLVWVGGRASGDPAIEVVERGEESRELFARGSLLALPLRVASGLRMRLLEAWAEELPVVATSAAIAGSDGEPERDVLVGDDAESFARQIVRLTTEPGLARGLVEGGRATLARRHDPRTLAGELLAQLAGVARRDSR